MADSHNTTTDRETDSLGPHGHDAGDTPQEVRNAAATELEAAAEALRNGDDDRADERLSEAKWLAQDARRTEEGL